MRVLRWGGLVAVAAWIGLFVASTIQRQTLPLWVLYAPFWVFGVMFLVSAVRNALHPRRGGAVRGTLGPVVRGFDDVQDIYFGRNPGITPRYGSDEPEVAALVEEHPDPLDDPHWVLGRTATRRTAPPTA